MTSTPDDTKKFTMELNCETVSNFLASKSFKNFGTVLYFSIER